MDRTTQVLEEKVNRLITWVSDIADLQKLDHAVATRNLLSGQIVAVNQLEILLALAAHYPELGHTLENAEYTTSILQGRDYVKNELMQFLDYYDEFGSDVVDNMNSVEGRLYRLENTTWTNVSKTSGVVAVTTNSFSYLGFFRDYVTGKHLVAQPNSNGVGVSYVWHDEYTPKYTMHPPSFEVKENVAANTYLGFSIETDEGSLPMVMGHSDGPAYDHGTYAERAYRTTVTIATSKTRNVLTARLFVNLETITEWFANPNAVQIPNLVHNFHHADGTTVYTYTGTYKGAVFPKYTHLTTGNDANLLYIEVDYDVTAIMDAHWDNPAKNYVTVPSTEPSTDHWATFWRAGKMTTMPIIGTFGLEGNVEITWDQLTPPAGFDHARPQWNLFAIDTTQALANIRTAIATLQSEIDALVDSLSSRSGFWDSFTSASGMITSLGMIMQIAFPNQTSSLHLAANLLVMGGLSGSLIGQTRMSLAEEGISALSAINVTISGIAMGAMIYAGARKLKMSILDFMGQRMPVNGMTAANQAKLTEKAWLAEMDNRLLILEESRALGATAKDLKPRSTLYRTTDNVDNFPLKEMRTKLGLTTGHSTHMYLDYEYNAEAKRMEAVLDFDSFNDVDPALIERNRANITSINNQRLNLNKPSSVFMGGITGRMEVVFDPITGETRFEEIPGERHFRSLFVQKSLPMPEWYLAKEPPNLRNYPAPGYSPEGTVIERDGFAFMGRDYVKAYARGLGHFRYDRIWNNCHRSAKDLATYARTGIPSPKIAENPKVLSIINAEANMRIDAKASFMTAAERAIYERFLDLQVKDPYIADYVNQRQQSIRENPDYNFRIHLEQSIFGIGDYVHH